jgi:hypothetical protein
MKIIKKTRKYLHVRMTEDEYELLQKSILEQDIEKQKEEEQLAYAEWFFTNHVEINWQDEYSSWHTDWRNIHTGKYVQNPNFHVTIYKSRFADVIKDNKKLLKQKK